MYVVDGRLQAAMKRLLAEGHELGSHAAIHLHLGELPTAEAKQQIEWAVGNISAVTGSKSVPVRVVAEGCWSGGVDRWPYVHCSWPWHAARTAGP